MNMRVPPASRKRASKPAAAPSGSTRKGRFWEILNSPVVLLLISGVAVAGGARLYSDHQASIQELRGRRAEYVELLAEIQNRVSHLQDADSELNEYIGTGFSKDEMKVLPKTGPRRTAFERASIKVGQRELDILRGTGSYVATAPVFANTHLLTLGARLERIGGIPDLQMGALRLLRFLDADGEIVWLFVRSYMPMLQKFVVTRHIMHTNGTLPLEEGAELTKPQEAALGIPDPKPGELEALIRENDVLSEQLEAALDRAAATE